jgi:hypothetical protein
VAAAAVVAAAVPLGLTQLAPTSDGGGRVADEPTATSGLPPGVIETGYRAESWHDVTFEVPADWGYGGISAWCSNGDSSVAEEPPVITRPDTMVPMIMCTPGNGYGVTIGSPAAVYLVYESGHVWQYDTEGVDEAFYPDDAWLGSWYDQDTLITVVTPDRATTQRVVDSVQKIDGVDPNGCAPDLGAAEALVSDGSGSLSICRYDEQDLLTASRRLTGEEARDAEDAIFSGPIQDAIFDDCPTRQGRPPRTAILNDGAYVATVVADDPCEPGINGVFMSGAVRVVTDRVREAIDLTRLP